MAAEGEKRMTVYIDADACPVVRIAEQTAKEYGVPVVLLCDTNHVLSSGYSEVRVIGAGADAVDFALVNLCRAGDLVITQDYGLASMAMGKGACVIHQSGMRYTEENIGGLLMDRYVRKKARMASAKNHLKGPSKRTAEDDARFAQALKRLMEEMLRNTESEERTDGRNQAGTLPPL